MDRHSFSNVIVTKADERGKRMYYKIADCFVKYEPNYMYMQKKIKPYEERFHGESENSCIYLGYKSDAYYKKSKKCIQKLPVKN